MKLSPDSPELTAYALGELSSEERAAVEAALAASPELRAEVAALWDTSARLTQEFAAEPAVELDPAQRAAIVGAEAQRAEKTPRRSARNRSTDATPSWLARLLAWRDQLIWATAAVAVLVLTLALWPRQRDVESRFAELRYQRLPAPAPEAAATPTALPAASPAVAVAADALVDRLQLADQPPATGGLVRELRAQPTEIEVLKRTETLSAGVPVKTLAAPVKSELKSKAHPSGAIASLGASPSVAAPPTSPAGSSYSMDPALARRYGVIPGQGDVALSFGESAPRAAAGISGADHYYRELPGDRLPEILGRQRSESLRLWPLGTESYRGVTDNPFKEVSGAPLSTFSLDVDTASYANVRRFLREGSLPPADAVRLEELINYFHYDYPAPSGSEPFATAVEIADCPWKPEHKLVRIGLQAKTVNRTERPRANLVFLLDVSGSMEPENKLPLVKRSLRLLLDKLGEQDAVGIVTYAGQSRVALESTTVTAEGRKRIADVIEGLRAGSGTAGGAGIVSAYALATNHFIRGGVNRVLLCTDGDFNIGITEPAELHRLIETQAKSGVFLSVLGYGLGNLKDSTMELLADKGNGNYAYVDSFSEARKVLGEQLEGTLITVAKDVKVQVEFNPSRVKSYRLLGYENRLLRDRDFNDDTKDAGEVGAGHQITVLYELEPTGANLAGTDPLRYQPKSEEREVQPRLKTGYETELLNLKLRYKAPDGEQSRLIETPVKDASGEIAQADADFKFAAAVAAYGMLLRDSPHKGDLTWDAVLRLAERGLGSDKEGYRAEFVDLARKAQQLSGGR